MTYFIDTSYLIALEVADDQFHESALEHWTELVSRRPRFITTLDVLGETATFLNVHRAHDKAVDVVTRIRSSPSFEVVSVDDALWERAWEFFAGHHDKTFSVTDGISFMLMRDRRLTLALTFDRHFRQAGFQVEPAMP